QYRDRADRVAAADGHGLRRGESPLDRRRGQEVDAKLRLVGARHLDVVDPVPGRRRLPGEQELETVACRIDAQTRVTVVRELVWVSTSVYETVTCTVPGSSAAFVWPVSTSTLVTSTTPASQRPRACVTWIWSDACSESVSGAKTSARSPQPNCGRSRRSPG